MGYMRHHAIVVTCYDDKQTAKAHKKAVEVFALKRSMVQGVPPRVSEIITSPINGYYTFLVAPDGSKEGWADSEDGDKERETFIAWMRKMRAEDKMYLDWVCVQYGDDDRETKIDDDSDRTEKEQNVNDIDA